MIHKIFQWYSNKEVDILPFLLMEYTDNTHKLYYAHFKTCTVGHNIVGQQRRIVDVLSHRCLLLVNNGIKCLVFCSRVD